MKILFVCKGNSCRSAMAEGIAKNFFPQNTIHSGGIKPEPKVNLFAVSVMNDLKIDISKHNPKHIKEFRKTKYDIVVCFGQDVYIETTKYFNQDTVCYYDVKDPADFIGTDEEIIEFYKKTRDSIKEIILSFNLKNYH